MSGLASPTLHNVSRVQKRRGPTACLPHCTLRTAQLQKSTERWVLASALSEEAGRQGTVRDGSVSTRVTCMRAELCVAAVREVRRVQRLGAARWLLGCGGGASGDGVSGGDGAAAMSAAMSAAPLASMPEPLRRRPLLGAPAPCGRHFSSKPKSRFGGDGERHKKGRHKAPAPPAAAASASSPGGVAASSEGAPGSIDRARCAGTVVTSQANFLRVVVKGGEDSITPEQRDERLAQFARAVATARAAGKMDTVEKLERRMEKRGPYELLCTVRALLKKIKQRVLVGDGVNLSSVDWVDNQAMVESVQERRSELIDPSMANVDHALLVFALERPPLEAKQLTRFLAGLTST